MAHMILCLFVGGPMDGEMLEVNDQQDEVRFEPQMPPMMVKTPPIAQDNMHNVVRRYHVYGRDDATSFTYKGFY